MVGLTGKRARRPIRVSNRLRFGMAAAEFLSFCGL